VTAVIAFGTTSQLKMTVLDKICHQKIYLLSSVATSAKFPLSPVPLSHIGGGLHVHENPSCMVKNISYFMMHTL
jgi:hypothetical protein